MNDNFTNESIINISGVIEAIKKRWKLLVISALIFVIGAICLSFFILEPKYQSTVKLFVGKEENSDEIYSNNDVQLYQNISKSYLEIIKTNDLVTRALEENNINKQAGEILKNLSATTTMNTQILTISYVSKDAVESQKILESITNEFIKTSSTLVKNVNVKVVESAKIAKSPISPNKKLNIAIGLAIGLIIGIVLCLILELLDTTIKDSENLEEITGLPVLGVIPIEKEQ